MCGNYWSCLPFVDRNWLPNNSWKELYPILLVPVVLSDSNKFLWSSSSWDLRETSARPGDRFRFVLPSKVPSFIFQSQGTCSSGGFKFKLLCSKLKNGKNGRDEA
jgi:hypothetical protein